MQHLNRNILLLLAALFTSASAFSQSGAIRVRFIGNCGLYLTDGTSNLYIDFPYKSGAYHYMTYDPAQLDSIPANAVLLFTHRHADHYSRKLVRRARRPAYGPWNIAQLQKPEHTLPDFTIQAFRTKHRFSLKHDSYLITWHGRKLYISGDTENPETIASVKGIDWAFVPSWIIFNARKKNLNIDARNFAIYHLYPTEKLEVITPGIRLLDKQNEEFTIAY